MFSQSLAPDLPAPPGKKGVRRGHWGQVFGSRCIAAIIVWATASSHGLALPLDAILWNAQASSAVAVEKRSAAAVADAAAQIPKTQFSEKLLDSPGFADEVRRQQTVNTAAASATDQPLIDKIRAALPRFKDTASQLKYGRHITISGDGDEAIALIRTAAATPREREAALARLQMLAQNRVPEALNIYGFLLETGSLGAPRDLTKATQYYQSAANAGYQPAVYNLALMSSYGRGSNIDLTRAMEQLHRAQALGNEDSFRVCGMTSFIAFRRGKTQEALAYSAGCGSALAHLASATSDTRYETLNKRVELLRDSLMTGADDAYSLLVDITKPHASKDPEKLYCKYKLVNEFRDKTDFKMVKASAQACLASLRPAMGFASADSLASSQLVAGVTGFVPTEIEHLRKMRQSNHFHYSWPVPYLPFGQQEVDIFQSIVGAGGKAQ